MKSRGELRMVDVSGKSLTAREAVAKGRIKMQPSTLNLIKEGKIEKGDVLPASRLAGILAAKQTANLIPLCHPVPIEDIKIDFKLDELKAAIEITASVKGVAKTGFEMEALVAVTLSALTIYDMCKPVDPAMHLEGIRLVKKSGGKSGTLLLK